MRRTPLRAKKGLTVRKRPFPGPRKPIKPFGKASQRLRPTYTTAVDVVMNRANGKCEWCGAARPTSPHHVFMRTHLIPVAIANLPECILACCVDCHAGAHVNAAVMGQMRWTCAEKLQRLWAMPHTEYRAAGWTALQAVRDLIRRREVLAVA